MTQLTVLKDRFSRSLSPAKLRDRVANRVRSTPGRLRAYLLVLSVLGLLAGLASVVGAVQRGDAVDAVATSSGPLAVRAQGLYRSLSDADATAAAAFLSAGSEPPQLRQRYLDDIAAASSALAQTRVSSDAEQTPVTRIATALPTYTGLVETARAQNRLNLPVGAAYLREASTLMRTQLLPAADDLYQIETDRLATDRSSADGFPWLSVPLILLTLGGLWVTQLYLVRRTQRLVNVGLAIASAAAVVLLLWVGFSWIGVASNLASADRDGSAQVQAVARVRIGLLQARADEALTLVARGSGGQYEDDYTARLADLIGADGHGGQMSTAIAEASDPSVHSVLSSARDDLVAWRAAHQKLHGDDVAGQYPQAVQAAVTGQSSLFGKIDGELQQALTTTGATFNDRATAAADALTLTVAGWTVLTVTLVAALVIGLQTRIAEYR
jgi:hypothetical protein